jgi:uncharacterized membrane protein YphA (DoxX/SURF4 family)
VLFGQRWFSRLALTSLSLPYWWSGLDKLAHFQSAIAEVRGLGIGHAAVVVTTTVCVQLIGSVLVISGYSAWLGAGALAVFTGLATLAAHGFWSVADPVARAQQFNSFLEHAGLIGAFMLAAAFAQVANTQVSDGR